MCQERAHHVSLALSLLTSCLRLCGAYASFLLLSSSGTSSCLGVRVNMSFLSPSYPDPHRYSASLALCRNVSRRGRVPLAFVYHDSNREALCPRQFCAVLVPKALCLAQLNSAQVREALCLDTVCATSSTSITQASCPERTCATSAPALYHEPFGAAKAREARCFPQIRWPYRGCGDPSRITALSRKCWDASSKRCEVLTNFASLSAVRLMIGMSPLHIRARHTPIHGTQPLRLTLLSLLGLPSPWMMLEQHW